ncbi:HesB/IscA family protein [Rubritalea marina]|uniref:HesB/IscA family protein n=1 Tax=Rubritalea marina TaxID=361055 RepID=UPI00036975E0|nr:iron-sulfur cluster assembly accessory protein [Rubritalea marina]
MEIITLSQSAIKELKNLLAKNDAPAGHGLRLSVQKGGCAGMQYVMEIKAAEAKDQSLEQDGAIVHIDPESFEYLEGCQLVYEYSLSDSGFRLQNPNASRSCGCGTSFEAKGEEGSYDPANDCK